MNEKTAEREMVSAMGEIGYEVEDTGGGCRWFRKGQAGGDVVVTRWGEPQVPDSLDERVEVTLCAEDIMDTPQKTTEWESMRAWIESGAPVPAVA